MTTATLPAVALGRLISGVAACAVAAAILFVAVPAHLHQACVTNDTPYLPLCEEQSPEARKEELRERIARNPGDSWTWNRLLVAEGDAAEPALLQAATRLSPNHPNVLPRRAADALRHGRHEEGVALLILMVKQRQSVDAARLIAQLAGTPEGVTLLRPHLAQAGEWLPGVLAAMPAAKLPIPVALPLVTEAQRQGVLSPALRLSYINALKAGGHWLDAYGLWLSSRGQQVPLLYNSSFDEALTVDGFGWEGGVAQRSRAGVRIEQHSSAKRGLVLELEFTGREFSLPVLRQYLLLAPGTYRLRGDYVAQKLRPDAALRWILNCPGTRKAAPGTSTELQDTGGMWKPFEAGFTVAPECGAIASLELVTVNSPAAVGGFKGRVQLDDLKLSIEQN